MTPANSKTYEAILYLESNGFKFPQTRGEKPSNADSSHRALGE